MVCSGFISCVYSLFDSIPAAVGSALCAAIATLAGVAFTGRDARKRLKIQLDHDAREKMRDREHGAEGKREERQSQIRREIFMDAFDGVTTSIQSLARLCDLNTPMASASTAIADAGSKIARLRAIGNHSTVLALTNLTSTITVANVTLVGKRAIIDGKTRHMLSIDSNASRQNADHDRWLDMQSQMLVQGPIPQDRFNFIQNRIEFHRNEAKRLATLRAEIERGIGVETLALIRLLVEQQRFIATAAVEANMAMRQELGFSGELEDVVRTALENQDEAGRNALSEHVKTVEASLAPSIRA